MEETQETTLNRIRNHAKILYLFAFFFVFFSVGAGTAHAASFSLSPPNGTFYLGSTFGVSLSLNTEGETVNAIGALLSFPPDKLQLVSPSAGESIIGVWTAQPKFNNLTGNIDLNGIIPGGIKTSRGVISTFTFRAKTPGQAVIRFREGSEVLLHDGRGTNVLQGTAGAIYQLVLPPPLGPLVVSETHPEQTAWYSNPNVVLQWERDEAAQGYSYVLTPNSVELADDISEGLRTDVAYKNLPDGVHYFHIKALRDEAWGGSTHVAVKIDRTPPAEFPIEVLPSSRVIQQQPIIQFSSTDALSGIDHYELKLLPLGRNQNERVFLMPQTIHAAYDDSAMANEQPLFIEAESPYVPSPLELGRYAIIVRAYDKAQNSREEVAHFEIVNPLFWFMTDEGIEVRGVTVRWSYIWASLLMLIIFVGYVVWRIRTWHKRVEEQGKTKELPVSVKKQLEDLKRYRAKYGSKALMVLCFMLGLGVLFHSYASAQEAVGLNPPFVSTISRNISNEEIFYIGGKTEAPEIQVIIYLQNLQSGETRSQSVVSDKKGDWLYRHDNFLVSGNYLLWTQSKIGEALSPPGPQIQMSVRPTALQFGASRVSYETVYIGIILVLSLILAGLFIYGVSHSYHGRKKHRRFIKEVHEAEESVRRGFAVLRRDIEAELALVKKAKLTKTLSAEEAVKEEQLLKDLDWVEKYVGEEIWDVEKEIQ